MYKKRLIELGCNAGLSGFEMLNTAFELYRRDLSMQRLIQQIAQKYNSTPTKVERNMRTVFKEVKPDMAMKAFIGTYKMKWDTEYCVDNKLLELSEAAAIGLWKVDFVVDTGYSHENGSCIIRADSYKSVRSIFIAWIKPQLVGESSLILNKVRISQLSNCVNQVIYTDFEPTVKQMAIENAG